MRVLTPIKDGMALPARFRRAYPSHDWRRAPPGCCRSSIQHLGQRRQLDFNTVRAGSTVYVRAQRYGGMLTLGDAHAYMSDGELTGTGVEIDMTVTIRIDRAPDLPTGGV